MKIQILIKDPKATARRKGLKTGGAVQTFHTSNVMRHMEKYMPFRNGTMIKSMYTATDVRKPYIKVNTPYAHYIHHGVSHSGKPLKYTKLKHPLACAYYDRVMKSREGKQIQAELQRFITRG